MAITFVSKTQVNIDKKPRVYFTCHPEDFERCFDKVREDIFTSDKVHMNPKGYGMFMNFLRELLDEHL